MADETTNTATETDATPEAQATANTAAEPTQTETAPAEVMIPKTRFDQVNDRLKAIEAEAAKAKKAQADAETQALAEQGKYKELFEKQQAELAAAQATARANELRLLQRDAATEAKLPAALAERLKGETLEEMVADAKAILAALPKPAAPDINASNGVGGAPAVGQLDETRKAELAAAYGVSAKLM